MNETLEDGTFAIKNHFLCFHCSFILTVILLTSCALTTINLLKTKILSKNIYLRYYSIFAQLIIDPRSRMIKNILSDIDNGFWVPYNNFFELPWVLSGKLLYPSPNISQEKLPQSYLHLATKTEVNFLQVSPFFEIGIQSMQG